VNQVHLVAVRVLANLQAGWQADDAPHNSGPDFGKASPFGLLVVVLLLIGVVFLVRSMNRHLRELPDSFDAQHSAAATDVDAGATGADQPRQQNPDGRLPDEPDR
jgi:hypothetical protein